MTVMCGCTLVVDIVPYEEIKMLKCPRCSAKGGWHRIN